MKSLLFPLPDVTELAELPAEFDAIALREVAPGPSPAEAARLSAERLRAKREPVQVLHLDDARASTYALFA